MKNHEWVYLLAEVFFVIAVAFPLLVVLIAVRRRRSLAKPMLGVWLLAIFGTLVFALAYRSSHETGVSMEIAYFDHDGDGWVDVSDWEEVTLEQSEAYGLHTGELGRRLNSMGAVILSPLYGLAVMLVSIIVLAGLRRVRRRHRESALVGS